MNSAEWCIIAIVFSGSVLMIGVILLPTVTPEYLESATCKQLMDLTRQSDYGVEYHNEWILKECWK